MARTTLACATADCHWYVPLTYVSLQQLLFSPADTVWNWCQLPCDDSWRCSVSWCHWCVKMIWLPDKCFQFSHEALLHSQSWSQRCISSCLLSQQVFKGFCWDYWKQLRHFPKAQGAFSLKKILLPLSKNVLKLTYVSKHHKHAVVLNCRV